MGSTDLANVPFLNFLVSGEGKILFLAEGLFFKIIIIILLHTAVKKLAQFYSHIYF